MVLRLLLWGAVNLLYIAKSPTSVGEITFGSLSATLVAEKSVYEIVLTREKTRKRKVPQRAKMRVEALDLVQVTGLEPT